VVGFAAIGLGFWGSPQVFVRFISLRSEAELKKGAAVALTWTLLADSGAVLVGMTGRALYDSAMIGGDADNILPFMSQTLLPSFIAGVFIAMVLSAIMSTIDSLLVVASSAAVRDYWQKTRHPDMGDRALVSLSQKLTFTLAIIAFALGMGILAYDKDEGVFWIIIFGWSGIAATFCPTMILSLFWSGMTALAARCAMIAGFLSVPVFKFLAPWLLVSAGLDELNQHLTNLDVLAPSFAVSILVGIVVSLMDTGGQRKLEGVTADLAAAKHGPAPEDAQPPA